MIETLDSLGLHNPEVNAEPQKALQAAREVLA